MSDNGGVIGGVNVPTTTVASGVWRPSYVARRILGQTSGENWPSLKDASYASVSGLYHMQNFSSTGDLLDSGPNAKDLVYLKPLSSNAGITASPAPLFGRTALKVFVSDSGSYGVKTNALFGFGTGDFCFEWFMYCTGFGTLGVPLDFRGTNGVSLGPIINVTTGAALVFSKDGNTTDITSAGSAITANAWHYAAVARVSGTTRMYLGLASGATAAKQGSDYTDSNNYPASGTGSITVGVTIGVTLPLIGYMTEVRVTKGAGRGYTGSTIAVPKAPFPDY